MRWLNIVFVVAFFASVIFIFTPTTSAAYTGPFSDVCSSPEAKTTAVCQTKAPTNPVLDTIGAIVTLISIIAGAVAVLIIIWAGFQFIIGNGDTAKIAKARQTILYAVIGLIVIISGNMIVQFVISKL